MIKLHVLVHKDEYSEDVDWYEGVFMTEHICGFYYDKNQTVLELLNGNSLVVRESIDEISIMISESRAFVFKLN